MIYPISSSQLIRLALLLALAPVVSSLSAQCGTVVHIEPPSQVFCNAPGSSVTLSAQPLGGVFTGQSVRGDGYLSLDKLAVGSYWMYYTAPDSCATKDSVEIHVQHVGSEITQLNPFDCASNRSSLLQVVATNDETLFFEGVDWNFNTLPGDFKTQTLSTVNPYRLEVSNSQSGQRCISEVQPLYINPTRLQTRTNLDCQADSLGISVVGQRLPASASWKFFDDFAYAKTGPVDTGLQLSPKQIGNYQVSAIYPNGCTSAKTVWVPVIDSFMPQVTLPSRVLLPCTNEAIMLPCEITTGAENGRPYISWVSDTGEGLRDSSSLTPTIDQIGTYTVFVTDSVSGCSPEPMSVRVSQAGPQQDTFRQEICHGTFYDWEGRRHRESGIYDRSFQNAYGCDSNRVLVLEVLAKAQDTVSLTSCAGAVVEFGGDTLRTAGEYWRTFTNAKGCDSTVLLKLDITPVEVNNVTQTICWGEQYVLGNDSLIESGIYRQAFQTTAGCDSVVELNLVVLPESSTSSEATICEGDIYQFGDQTLFEEGMYSDTFSSVVGCDSTVALRLHVLPTVTTDIVAQICEGEAYQLSGQSFTSTGLYTLAFGAANGCDSLFNLDLTVAPPMLLTLDTINISNASEGDIVVRVEGGAPPYRFQWSNGASGDNVPIGTVVSTVEVFDANGCEQVLVLGRVSNNSAIWARELSVGPNPTRGVVQWNYSTTSVLTQVEIRNARGQLLARQVLKGTSNGQLDFGIYPAGLYLVDFTSSTGETYTARIVRL